MMDPKTCGILQRPDSGRRTASLDCGRPAKFKLADGRGVCGIHARGIPKPTLLGLGMGIDRLTGQRVYMSDGS